MADGRAKNGGARKGAGRKSTKHEYVDDGQLSPLQLMLGYMRDQAVPINLRLETAYKAAPYCHARLQSITADVDADIAITLVSYLDNSDSDTAD